LALKPINVGIIEHR